MLSLALLWGSAGVSATTLTLFNVFPNAKYAEAAVGGLRGIGSGTLELTNLPAGAIITGAYLYWQGHLNDPGDALLNAGRFTNGYVYVTTTASVSAQLVKGTCLGPSAPDLWDSVPYTYGLAYRADLTALVRQQGSGAYLIRPNSPLGANAEGASLVVFYQDGDTAHYRTLAVYDGNDCNAPSGFDALGWNLLIPAVSYQPTSPPTPAYLHLHVADGQAYPDDNLYLNNRVLAPQPNVFNGDAPYDTSSGYAFTYYWGSLWDANTYDITSFLVAGNNTLSLTTGLSQDALSLVAAVLDMPASGAGPSGPPANNQPPTIQAATPVTLTCVPSTGLAAAVAATVGDSDGDPLTVTWLLNGTQVQQDVVPGGAPSATQATVVLTNAVFLPGVSTVVAIVSDAHNAPVSYTITVDAAGDTTPPQVTCALSTVVVVSNPAGQAPAPNVLGQVTATDDCGAPTLSQRPTAGLLVGVGTNTITVTATDIGGNKASCVVTLIVLPSPTSGFGGFNTNCATFTQKAWGTPPHGHNAGALLATYFSFVYPHGVTVGGAYTLQFDSAGAIDAFLPQHGKPVSLTQNQTDPTGTLGAFAGEVLALQLNVDFSAANVTQGGLGSQRIARGKLAGLPVTVILALANQVLGGNLAALPPGVTLPNLKEIVARINRNFSDGTANRGYLVGGNCNNKPSGGDDDQGDDD